MPESSPLLEFESVWSDLQGVAFSQGYLDAGGVRTRYLHAGDRGKPALVLLHGSGGHAEAYVRNLEAHAEHFSTWSIDMLGHGYTDKPGHPLEVRPLRGPPDGVPRRDRCRARPHQRRVARRLGGRARRRRPPGPDRPTGAQHRGRIAGRPRGDEAHHHAVDGGRREPDLGDGAGAHQVADGRQVQGLRRHRRQPSARVPPAGIRRCDERHHGAAGSGDPRAKPARPERVRRRSPPRPWWCGPATTRPPTSARAAASRR